jgi:AcrR family transcriptional regulator
MDRIADAIDYSKPVVYQHFPCKEEIVLALATQSALIRLRLHERVLQFEGNSRERMIASGEATVVLHADHLQCELITLTNALASKTSEMRLQLYQRTTRKTIVTASSIVKEGVAAGDLTLPEGLNPEAFTFSLWATIFGGFSLLNTGTDLFNPGTPYKKESTPENVHLVRMCGRGLLDAYGWRPLSMEWDYRETMRRIYREVFPPEVIGESVTYGTL